MKIPGASSWIWPLIMWQFERQAAGSQFWSNVSSVLIAARVGRKGCEN